MAFSVSSAIRWCSLHLALLFRQRRRPHLGHLAIPPEIISIIVAHLDKPSIMSLALTCRTFFHLCFPRSSELSLPEREDFLLLLEKDVAHLSSAITVSSFIDGPRPGSANLTTYILGSLADESFGLPTRLNTSSLTLLRAWS
jgi:hypothetical protein